MTKRFGISLTVLILNLAARADCPPPRHEQCAIVPGDVTVYYNCNQRNRREDDRYQQCLDDERKEQERERKEKEQERKEKEREREEQEQEKFCKQHPDDEKCQ